MRRFAKKTKAWINEQGATSRGMELGSLVVSDLTHGVVQATQCQTCNAFIHAIKALFHFIDQV